MYGCLGAAKPDTQHNLISCHNNPATWYPTLIFYEISAEKDKSKEKIHFSTSFSKEYEFQEQENKILYIRLIIMRLDVDLDKGQCLITSLGYLGYMCVIIRAY